MITLCYFRSISPSSISNLVHNWAVNNILDGVYLIHLGIILQWIPKPSHIQSKCKISKYEKKHNISQVLNQNTWKV